MVMFLLFLIINVGTIGIFYGVYGTKRKYAEGMLMGVHLPASAVETEEVKMFMEEYYKKTKWFYILNLLVGIAVCGACFWYFSIFMILWSIWLVELSVGAILLLYRTHRKLYDMKVKNGWIGSGGSKIMTADSVADTKVSVQSGKMGVSPLWHLLFLGLILLTFLMPQVRFYLKHSEDGWILIGCALAAGLVFVGIHVVILRTQNKVYSEKSELNLAVNRMQKDVWSWIMIGSGFFNTAAYLAMTYSMDEHVWIGEEGYVLYIVLESIPVVLFVGGALYINKRRTRLLQANAAPLYVDDDIYWKNGWYNNPNDKRLLVQDWACSFNYATNMARPAGKISLVAGIVITIACLVWGCALMLRIDFSPMKVSVESDKIEITSGYSDVEIDFDEVESVEILPTLPKDEYKRVNGSSDTKKKIGKFKGREIGKCRMYIYVGCTPVLKIDTSEGPVFVNSTEEGNVEKWYEKIVQEKNRVRS